MKYLNLMKTSVIVITGLMLNDVSASVVRVSPSDFVAGSGKITFSEFASGTSNPSYASADYGGGAGSPSVEFGGFFTGQSLSLNPGVDCPGAAASACITGNPTGPLSLDPSSPVTFISSDASNPTSPILSGTPLFNGPIAILFDKDLAGVGFDAGFFNGENSTGITAFDRNGSLLGTVSNIGLGIEFLGLVTDNGLAQIAGVFLDLHGAEPAGFGIDNVFFGQAGQVIVPGQVPAPATLALVGSGFIGFFIARRRKSIKQ